MLMEETSKRNTLGIVSAEGLVPVSAFYGKLTVQSTLCIIMALGVYPK